MKNILSEHRKKKYGKKAKEREPNTSLRRARTLYTFWTSSSAERRRCARLSNRVINDALARRIVHCSASKPSARALEKKKKNVHGFALYSDRRPPPRTFFLLPSAFLVLRAYLCFRYSFSRARVANALDRTRGKVFSR